MIRAQNQLWQVVDLMAVAYLQQPLCVRNGGWDSWSGVVTVHGGNRRTFGSLQQLRDTVRAAREVEAAP